MDASRFDRITQLFTQRRLSRRQAMTGTVGAGITGITSGLVATQMPALAQNATPVASPAASPVAATGSPEKTTYLFVQSFQSGTLVANKDNDRHTLTLEHGLGQTIYFGDRPSRDVGVTPTKQFLDGLGFTENNPPNAALIVETGTGESDLAVLELFAPTYDEATHTATYQVQGLEAWQDTLDLGFTDAPTDLAGMATQFSGAHLLIDDCANGTVTCFDDGTPIGEFDDLPFCYNYGVCMPCEPYGHVQPDKCSTSAYWGGKCVQQYASSGTCEDVGECYADFPAAVFLGCQ